MAFSFLAAVAGERAGNCPPTAQIPACGTTALSALEILASARLSSPSFCVSLHFYLPCFPGPACPDKVSSVNCVSRSIPSPRKQLSWFARDRPYRLRVLRTDPTPEGLQLSYLSFRFGLPALRHSSLGYLSPENFERQFFLNLA